MIGKLKNAQIINLVKDTDKYHVYQIIESNQVYIYKEPLQDIKRKPGELLNDISVFISQYFVNNRNSICLIKNYDNDDE